jgi:uncharacterized membrane protein
MRFPGARNKDIERWVQKGLIDPENAKRLKAELEEASGGFGLGGVLGIFGALLFGAAIITLVAANWETIPRLARVTGIIATIWAAWLAGAWRDSAGDKIFSQALYLIGTLTFGAGIALTGQMYHTSGDAATAAVVWTLGAISGAALLRSPVISAAAAGLGLFYLAIAVTDNTWHESWYVVVAPLIAASVFALSHWNGSRAGKHGAVWLLLATLVCHRFSRLTAEVDQLDYIFAFGGAALFVALSLAEDTVDRVTGFAHALLGYALLVSFFGFTQLQLGFLDERPSTAMIGLIVLALCVGALLLKGRDHGGVRALAYTAFGAEILYLAAETIGTILDTSVFFFVAGLIVMVIAWLMVRIERRMKAQAGQGAPA